MLKIINKLKEKYYYSNNRLNKLSKDELLAIIRHDCHRIEKSVYNNILSSKKTYFEDKKEKVKIIFSLLKRKNWYSEKHPILIWAQKIIYNFDNLENDFVLKYNKPSPIFNLDRSDELIDIFKSRRSCRTWSDNQPDAIALEKLAYKMIDGARWSPNSGNRQAWQFGILTNSEDRILLKGLKEKHCYSAPLLIFIGMDSRFYSPATHLEDCLFIDAGAAIMQMVNIANISGIGVCWNHFSMDFINSRKQNVSIYKKFSKKLNIANYIKPVAILSIGNVKYLPPTPSRLEIEDLLINNI